MFLVKQLQNGSNESLQGISIDDTLFGIHENLNIAVNLNYLGYETRTLRILEGLNSHFLRLKTILHKYILYILFCMPCIHI